MNKYAVRYSSIDQQPYLRNHTRLLGKLLIALKRLSPGIIELKSAFDPSYWPNVLDAIYQVGKYDVIKNRFSVIYNAETIPILLRKLMRILKSHYTIEKDEYSQKQLEDFKNVFEDEIENEVGFTAGLSRREQQRQQVEKDLPASDEIKAFANFLMEKRQTALDAFEASRTYDNWLEILSLTSVLLILYNRRRAGETGKALLVDFRNRRKANPSSEFFSMLSKKEQDQRLKYNRMDIQGKEPMVRGSFFCQN